MNDGMFKRVWINATYLQIFSYFYNYLHQLHRVLFKNLTDGHNVKKLKASVKFQVSLSSQESATRF